MVSLFLKANCGSGLPAVFDRNGQRHRKQSHITLLLFFEISDTFADFFAMFARFIAKSQSAQDFSRGCLGFL
jgi:hypothetical protein